MVVLVLGVAYVIYIIQGGGEGDGPQLMEATGPAVIELGQRVYADSCAACHGANLEGQPGFDWREKNPDGTFPAPPHDETGHTWHHADEFLFRYTKLGAKEGLGVTGFKSNMAAFRDTLSDAEIWAVLAFIKSRWPAAIQERQERINQRNR